jgi:hypothetical protein
MSNRVSLRLKLASLAVLVVGMVSASVAYSLKAGNAPRTRPRKGFTITTKETTTLNNPAQWTDPQKIDHKISVKYQKTDGSWKQVTSYYKANNELVREDIRYGVPGQGVFAVDKARGTLDFISSMAPVSETSTVPFRDGHAHPNFLKDELVAGYQTYVLRFPDEDGGYMDISLASELDDFPVRRVTVSDSVTSISEVVSVEWGDPDDKQFGSLPQWLVNFGQYKQKIKALEDMGNQATADNMRRTLDQEIAKHVRGQ